MKRILSTTKKFTAFVLCTAIALPMFVFDGSPVSAAPANAVTFVDNISGSLTREAILLEGETIKTNIVKPDNYFLQSTQPFELVSESVTDPANYPFTMTPEGNITAKVKGGDFMEQYTIRPNFSAFLTESDTGVADLIIPALDQDGNRTGLATTEQVSAAATVIGNTDVSITKTSTISFSVSKNQSEPDGLISFGTATATDDLEADFNGALVSYHGREGKNVVVDITNVKGRKIRLSINCPSLPSLVDENTKFSFTFAVQTINTLQLTIISRQRAVNVIAADIAATANFADFVKLTAGDSSERITNRFQLVHRERRYNYSTGFYVDWEWKPDTNTTTNQAVLAITGRPTDMNYLATPYQILDDVPGKLVATVRFDDNITSNNPEKSEVPVTILGTGLMPSFKPLFSFTGTHTDGKLTIRQDPLTAVPLEMDVNDGTAEGTNGETGYPGTKPYEFTAELRYGTGLGRAQNIKITFDDTQNGEIQIFVDGSTTPYTPGTMLPLPSDSSSEVTRSLRIRATHEGLARMRIYYYNASGNDYNSSPRTHNITIVDTSPGKDPTFKSMILTGTPLPNENTPSEDDIPYTDRFNEIYPNGIIDYGYTPENETYDNISVPWAVKSVTITPTYNDNKLTGKSYTIRNVNTSQSFTVVSGNSSIAFDLPTNGDPLVIYVTGTAQDGKEISSYRLTITRMPPSNIASLVSLEVKTTRDDVVHTLTPAFNSNIYNYTLSLPYYYVGDNRDPSTANTETDALFTAIAYGDWGAKPNYTSDRLVSAGLFAIFQNKNQAKVDLKYWINPSTEAITNENLVTIRVRSEDKKAVAVYTVRIVIEDPSENTNLSDLKVSTQMKNGVVDLPYYQNIPFDKSNTEYYVDIDYSCDNIRFEFKPEDEYAQNVRIVSPDGDVFLPYKKKGELILRRYETKNTNSLYSDEFNFSFYVQAESGDWSAVPYTVHVTRREPSNDARLKSLTVVDAATNTDVFGQFMMTKQDYDINVDFTVESVSITPVANAPLTTTVSINGKEINEGRPSREFKLEAGKTTTITIETVPESGDADKMIYTLKITRRAPNTEARLISLAVNGAESITPEMFVPSTVRYTVNIPKGTQSYTVTANPVDPRATITVNGKSIGNGGTSEPIISAEARSTITVVVTAEDGKTTKTYTIAVNDYNYIKKSSAAEIDALFVNYADITPRFKSGITEYELYLKDNATMVELTPELRSNRATIEAKVGSKPITGYSGTYSTSVFDEQDNITLAVTSEDGTATKTYTFYVYKKDEEKQGAFKPITAEMVNYEEADPIVIDIRSYAIIDASVFNTLKNQHPDKSILFTGNDYSLRIKGSDITTLVPNTQQFDLAMKFTSPDEQIVEGLIYNDDYSSDQSIDPVYLYFNDHGDLPGKMILTLSLGGEFSNRPLFWNYYNDDRDRIDYYGYVNSNAKGTISVPVTHFSTYLVTKDLIKNSENKANMNFGSMEGITSSSSGQITTDKDVPRTMADFEG